MSGSSPTGGTPISATPIEPGRSPAGCARGALIGCGVAGLAVLAVLAGFLLYARKKPEALTDLLMGQVERHLAADVTPQEKEKLLAAYRTFRERLRERRAGREPIERLRAVLSSSPAGSIRADQVRDLTRAFEEDNARTDGPAAGVSPPAPAPEPTP